MASDDPDNNIRYIGANPNNYIYFNCDDYNNQTSDTCELWRIIGVFNNIEKEDGTKENLIKIVRNNSIGNYSWDNKDTTSGAEIDYGSNDWTTARLNYLLNPGHESESIGGSLYYNAKKGICYAGQNNATIACDFTKTGLKNDRTKNLIETVIWNNGGILNSKHTKSDTQQWYNFERGTEVYKNNNAYWTGKIALIYPSDYGYATSGNDETSRANCLNYNLYYLWEQNSNCFLNDYLFSKDENQFVLTSKSDISYDVFGIWGNGKLHDPYARESNYGVRPTLFLKSNISIGIGDGSSDSPYQLSL